MAPKKPQLGPSARTVAENIARCRKLAGHTMRSLAEEMSTRGFPMSHSVISQMENGARRIDVDELVALAAALGTTPSYLLMPDYTPENLEVAGTGTPAMSTEEYWSWITSQFDPTHRFPGEGQLTAQQIFDRLTRSRPAFDLGDYITWNFDGDR